MARNGATDGDERWHALPVGEAVRRLETRPQGLTAAEAEHRLARHGANALPPPPRQSALVRFLLQFHNVLIYVLLASAAIAALLGETIDAAVILGVVVINAVIGYVQEGKAERALESIRNLLSLQAFVLRDGERRQVAAETLVPGDVVLLQSGDKVPADLRLTRSKGLRVQEAILTGESMPVDKQVDAVAADAPIADRTCMAYSGTLVAAGQGSGVVVGTGTATEIGRISTLLQRVEALTTPLLRKLSRFSWWLTVVILGIAAVTFAFGLLVRDHPAPQMFMAAVALAVAAIPEGLPAILTIILAIGVQRMARRNAIVRRLPAVETLGAVSVICTDKTGTLTRNEMTVQTVVAAGATIDVSGVGYAPVGEFFRDGRAIPAAADDVLQAMARAAVHCSDAVLRQTAGGWQIAGDPTEGALLTFAAKAGLDIDGERRAVRRTDVIPFESQHKFMATLHHDDAGQATITVKGAPEELLPKCRWQRGRRGDEPIDPDVWHALGHGVAARGQRLLAIAVKPADAGHRDLRFEDVAENFTLLGLFGLIDPPREEAIRAIAQCREAGITVKMITGDHALTAVAIGRDLGLPHPDRVVTGRDLDAVDDASLSALAAETEIFARTSPEHKLRLVQALQARGEITAMTGDGVNDAPALKRADIGIAMGVKGTEAAKEAAQIVLADDNFATIAYAVEEGRTVYDNLRKSIAFLLPTNGGQAMMIIVAVLAGMTLPITPVQILWINMVTAVTLSLALAFEPTEADAMRRPPRPAGQPILTTVLITHVVVATAILVIGTFGQFLWAIDQGVDLPTARTIAVNALVFYEIFYLFNIRRLLAPVADWDALFGNRYVLLMVALVVALQLLFTYLPTMQTLFDTRPLPAATWAVIVAAAFPIFVLVEAEKAIIRAVRRKRRLTAA